MKKLLVLFLFACTAGFCQTKIARFKGNEYQFVIDTVKYKFNLEKGLVQDRDFSFCKIEIKKQETLITNKEFFYLLLTDKKNHIRIAKWLSKQKDFLISNDEITEGDLFEQTYLICEGIGDCGPQVMETDNGRSWGCSTRLICPVVEDPDPECKFYKVILEN